MDKPSLYRCEIQKLLEILWIWTFDLDMEYEKIRETHQRPEFLMRYLKKISHTGVPYQLCRGTQKYSLQNGFSFKL